MTALEVPREGECVSHVFARSARDEAIHSFLAWRHGLLRWRSQ
jgi:hypothetical protein